MAKIGIKRVSGWLLKPYLINQMAILAQKSPFKMNRTYDCRVQGLVMIRHEANRKEAEPTVKEDILW